MLRRRTLMGLSQEYVAGCVGVSEAAVHYWERRRRKPTRENCHKLALLLQVPAPDLAKDWGGWEALRSGKARGKSQARRGAA